MANFFKTLIGNIQRSSKQLDGFRKWVKTIEPKAPFSKETTPAAPDYADIDHWAAHPKKFSKALLTPEGIATTPSSDLKVDVFFIHPTCFFGTQSWNMPLGHQTAYDIIKELILPGQASAFNGVGRIYAPHYRQATFYSFIQPNFNSRKALELAYDDVARAFDYFIENANEGRPFILAAHSQGALHLTRLLEEKIENNSGLRQRFIAAYPIGFRFPKNKFGKAFHHLKPAQSATDLQVVINWDSYVDSGRPMHLLDKVEMWYTNNKWKRRAWKRPICINPLSWTASNDSAAASQNLGAVHTVLASGAKRPTWENFTSDEGVDIETIGLSAPFKEEVSAKVGRDGFLYHSKPKHRIFSLSLLPGGNYHMYDYALFYMNIRQNAIDRANAYFERH